MTTTVTTASAPGGSRGKARGMDFHASEDGVTPLKMELRL